MKKMKAARSKLRTDMTASINRQASKCVPTPAQGGIFKNLHAVLCQSKRNFRFCLVGQR
jgi:hypothetical protein